MTFAKKYDRFGSQANNWTHHAETLESSESLERVVTNNDNVIWNSDNFNKLPSEIGLTLSLIVCLAKSHPQQNAHLSFQALGRPVTRMSSIVILYVKLPKASCDEQARGSSEEAGHETGRG